MGASFSIWLAPALGPRNPLLAGITVEELKAELARRELPCQPAPAECPSGPVPARGPAPPMLDWPLSVEERKRLLVWYLVRRDNDDSEAGGDGGVDDGDEVDDEVDDDVETDDGLYDPEKDGDGAAFEDLPDDWCPVCGQPKSSCHPASLATNVDVASTYKCSVYAHMYDPEKDGDGAAFEDLPDDWKCPVCGQPKSSYHPASLTTNIDVASTYCSACAHVYDPEKDGDGAAFEDLPDDWKCPVCGQPKSSYSARLTTTLQMLGDGAAFSDDELEKSTAA